MSGWDWGTAGSGAMSGAATGAQIGGPWGALIGGVGGGALGGLTGGKGRNKGPKPPDFMALGQPTINTPWSSQSTSIGPDGKPVTNFSLTGDAGNALTAIQANMLKAAGMDPTQARDQAIRQNLGFAMERLGPQFDLQNRKLKSDMANAGLDPGTQAFNAANRELGQRQNDAFNSAYVNALNMGNQTQQTGMAQAMQPFLQNSSLINASMQQPNTPNMLGAASLAYKGALSQANAQNANKTNLLGGIGGLGGGKGGGKGGGSGGGGGAPSSYGAGVAGGGVSI